VEVGEWIQENLAICPLPEEARDYLMGRGATPRVIEEWGIRMWDPPLTPCPDPRLHKPYGEYFERFEEKLIYPLLSPKGRFLGFDSRRIDAKDDVRYLLPESRWNPVWIGMPTAMEKIWRGCDVIVVEGRFDVFAMYQAVEAAGADTAVVGSGPAHLSWKQVEFLRRWFAGMEVPARKLPPHVYMAYDNDSTGKKGIADALKHLGFRNVECSQLHYGENGDDPGAIWDRGGVEDLREAFPNL
jgi:DNA primase